MFAAFLAFLAVFLLVGLASLRARRDTWDDYFLAGRNAPPWMVGLSAVATNNSGYMFIGLVGYAYVVGLPAIWIGIGLVLGDFLSSLVVHRRFREAAGATGEASYAAVLARWQGGEQRVVRMLAALITLIFLIAYAAAQLIACGKPLAAMAGWPSYAGALLGFVLVVAYCFAGGVRASMWTDVVQAWVMVLSLMVLLAAAGMALGGAGEILDGWRATPGFLDWKPVDYALPGVIGGALFAVSWVFTGLSVTGQPHIMARIMTLRDPREYRRVRPWYYLWYAGMYLMVIAAGMLARLLQPELAGGDTELALPLMAAQLLPGVLVGLILAGVFSATLSTADSQILACSAALARDLLPRHFVRPIAFKISTVLCATVALGVALFGQHNVFNLVIFAWGAMGAAFGPLMFVYASGGRTSEPLAVTMILSGLVIAIGWRVAGLHSAMYEGMPAMLFSFALYFAWRFAARARAAGAESGAGERI